MRATVIRRATLTEPLPPTKMPRWPSGRAKKAVVSATRIWAEAASSSPPPTTAPVSAATKGIVPRWMRSKT